MVNILNIPLYDNSLTSAVNSLIKTCTDKTEEKQNSCVSATGAHGIVMAQKNKEFSGVLKKRPKQKPSYPMCISDRFEY